MPSVARSLEMSSKTLANWVYRARQGEALLKRPPVKPVSDLEAELARLRQENARLRVEKDILKKAAASHRVSFGHTLPRSRCDPRPATEVCLDGVALALGHLVG